MATRWERLAGDTSRFAVRLAFVDDPDAGAAADPDLTGSWGSFQIWVRNVNLCAHLELGERVESVYWYLLPMLEWFAEHWDPLLHEERLPCHSQATTAWRALRQSPVAPFGVDEAEEDRREAEWQTWWSRHAITAAREGGIFPDIAFRRQRDAVEVSWGSGVPPGTPDHVAFDISQPGAAALEPAEVAHPLHEMLEAASDYLGMHSPSSRIADLARAVRRLSRPRVHERLMWIAGLGTDVQTVRRRWRATRNYISASLPQRQAATLMAQDSKSRLVIEGSCHAALMFGSLAPRVERRDVVALCDMALRLTDSSVIQGLLADVSRHEPIVADRASWSQGYDLADELHARLDDDFLTGDHVDVDALLGRLTVEVTEVALTDASIRGVAMAGPQHRPGVAWNPENPLNASSPGRRFTLAHELCHVLFDHAAGRRLSIASGPWAPASVEQRSNAFAAMLLMPTTLVQSAVAGLNEPLATETGVSFVARRLRTGFEATLWHLGNLGVIEDIERQRIQAEHRTTTGANH